MNFIVNMTQQWERINFILMSINKIQKNVIGLYDI